MPMATSTPRRSPRRMTLDRVMDRTAGKPTQKVEVTHAEARSGKELLRQDRGDPGSAGRTWRSAWQACFRARLWRKSRHSRRAKICRRPRGPPPRDPLCTMQMAASVSGRIVKLPSPLIGQMTAKRPEAPCGGARLRSTPLHRPSTSITQRPYVQLLSPQKAKPDQLLGIRRLMLTMDRINREHGRGTLRIASAAPFEITPGRTVAWRGKCERRSPRYTTRWDELLVVRA
jgi:hypothetical protein